MLTREMLRNFRAGKREVMELRAKMRSAELAAARSDQATARVSGTSTGYTISY